MTYSTWTSMFRRAMSSRRSLLFFDQDDGPAEEWPIIGMGYHWDCSPCEPPTMECVPAESLFVHEAGYHHVIWGDGGMTVATTADLADDSQADAVDKKGCEDVDREDLSVQRFSVRHGRFWDLHAWFGPSGETTFAIEGPYERRRDAPDRIAIEGRAFFQPTCECTDPGPCGASRGHNGLASPSSPPNHWKGSSRARLAASIPYRAFRPSSMRSS